MKRLDEAGVLERYSFTGYREMPNETTLVQLGKMAADFRNGGEQRPGINPLSVEEYLGHLFDAGGVFVTTRRRDGGPIQAGVGLVNHPGEVSVVEFSLVLQNFASVRQRTLGRISLRTRLMEYMLYQYQDSQLAIVEIPANGSQRARLGYTVEELTRISGHQRLIICTNGELEEIAAGTGLKTMPQINLGPGMVADPVMLLADNPFARPYEAGGNDYVNSVLQIRSGMSGLEQSEFLGAMANGVSPLDLRFNNEEEL